MTSQDRQGTSKVKQKANVAPWLRSGACSPGTSQGSSRNRREDGTKSLGAGRRGQQSNRPPVHLPYAPTLGSVSLTAELELNSLSFAVPKSSETFNLQAHLHVPPQPSAGFAACIQTWLACHHAPLWVLAMREKEGDTGFDFHKLSDSPSKILPSKETISPITDNN